MSILLYLYVYAAKVQKHFGINKLFALFYVFFRKYTLISPQNSLNLLIFALISC